MKPFLMVAAMMGAVALGGCSTQWGYHPDDQNIPRTERAQQFPVPIRVQQMDLEVIGVKKRHIGVSDLQVGDLLLSGMTTFKSSAIQLATTSQVSHVALYVGDGYVVEAVGTGVRRYSVEQALADGETIVAYRRPELTADQKSRLKVFAMQQVGLPYNKLGIAMQAPLSLERKVCELPGMPRQARDVCIRALGSVQMAPALIDPRQSYFCSQLVLEAYESAGVPLTTMTPELVSPADVLHMREGDVSTIVVPRKLEYIGRLVVRPVVAMESSR